MSKYQCYEFVALDRALTSQRGELRAISTRADITPTRFWNEYEARHSAEAARAEKAKQAAAAAKNKRLDALAKRIDAAWSELARLGRDERLRCGARVGDGPARAGVRDGEDGDFAARFDALRKQHLRRRGFFDRWKRAHKAGEAAR